MIGSDIETAPLPLDVLERLHSIPTLEEFVANCNKTWKPDTKEKKYKEMAATSWQNFRDKAALSPMTGRVCCIGFYASDTKKFAILGRDQSEEAILELFWSHFAKFRHDKRIVSGHNFKGFDLPFLVKRSWILDVSVPDWVIHKGRFIADICFDTMEAWGLGSKAPTFIKIGKLAQIMDCDATKPFLDHLPPAGEEEVVGANFHTFWDGSLLQRQKASLYLKNDCKLVTDIATRMGVV